MTTATRTNPLSYLTDQLNELKAKGTHFKLRVLDDEQAPVCTFDGKKVINLASNNYLGLTTHPKLREAALEATRKYGVGSGAVRTIAGHDEDPHGAGRKDRALQERRSLRGLPVRLRGECRARSRPCWAKTTSSSPTRSTMPRSSTARGFRRRRFWSSATKTSRTPKSS